MCFCILFIDLTVYLLLLCGPVFLTIGIRAKRSIWLVNSQERRVPIQVGAMDEEGKIRVKRFNGQNYQLWKMQMEDYLYQKDLYLPLGRKEKQPAAMKNEEWEVLERKALEKIHLFLA